jgi:2-keto-4-pentenoate hydratase/2-oxohepta-3-ene-1,7-dioic acid hydratase in catechol pathway
MLFAVGFNYVSHSEEARGAGGGAQPLYPAFFTKPEYALVGPYDPIAIDLRLSQQWDYEGELAVVIGRGGRSIPERRALDHVFGYMIANDVSARDVQLRYGGQWFKGKAMDGSCPVGPCIVTVDELGDGSGLDLQCEVNGQVVQKANTSDMIFPIPRLIAELSLGMTLVPGDVILTGTPGGVGFARNPPLFLREGDLVVVRVTGIGEIRNSVVHYPLHEYTPVTATGGSGNHC